MYTQLNELNIYSFTILKIVSVRSGKKIQLMMTIPMNKILGRTILACKLFFWNFQRKNHLSKIKMKDMNKLIVLYKLYHIEKYVTNGRNH